MEMVVARANTATEFVVEAQCAHLKKATLMMEWRSSYLVEQPKPRSDKRIQVKTWVGDISQAARAKDLPKPREVGSGVNTPSVFELP